LLNFLEMPSLDNIHQKKTPALEPAAPTQLHPEPAPTDPQNQIGREVAHELNNILTIIQGYADRLVLKHGENLALRHDLQLISDNSHRAVLAIKKARGPGTTPAIPPASIQTKA
jgi:signal transduction histidine kinase